MCRAESGPAGAQFGILASQVVEVLNVWPALKSPGIALGRRRFLFHPSPIFTYLLMRFKILYTGPIPGVQALTILGAAPVPLSTIFITHSYHKFLSDCWLDLEKIARFFLRDPECKFCLDTNRIYLSVDAFDNLSYTSTLLKCWELYHLHLYLLITTHKLERWLARSWKKITIFFLTVYECEIL